MNEKILLDFYGSEKQVENTLGILKKRCDRSEIGEALSCYNLSILLYLRDDFDESFYYSKKAVEKDPNDTLYLDMMRHSAEAANRISELNAAYSVTNDIGASLSWLSLHCKRKDKEKAIAEIEQLVLRNAISKEFILNGFVPDCIGKEKAVSLSERVPGNKTNYSKYYLDEKNSMGEFHSIWDGSYFMQNKPIEKDGALKKKITIYWQNLRKAVPIGSVEASKESLRLFLKEARAGQEADKRNKHLFVSMERAAKLLIEQDKFFQKFRFLLQEF
ncbi:MAG: hypothetical protein K8R21_09875 [Leptospira sp.]|nr:hypothetical protein [Leptospira sp.]